MPYDEGDQCWKIHVHDRSGQFTGGYFDPDELHAQGAQTWRSRPKAGHFEVLYKIDPDRYAVLFRHGPPGKYQFTDADYFQELSIPTVVKWFKDEGHEVPTDLVSAANQDDSPTSARSAKKKSGKRGPKIKSDPKKEAKLYSDFKASGSSLKDFASARGIDFSEASKMIARHRARQARHAH